MRWIDGRKERFENAREKISKLASRLLASKSQSNEEQQLELARSLLSQAGSLASKYPMDFKLHIYDSCRINSTIITNINHNC